MINSAYNGNTVTDVKLNKRDLKDVTEYGYGFWLRFMMRFPTQIYEGKKDAWYFIARLANKEQYTDQLMGDRLLAVFQGLSTKNKIKTF